MADLYLSSVFETWWHTFEGSKQAAKLFREANRTRTPADMIRSTFRTSGGVFYDGDTTTDPLLAAGLKWPDLYSNCEEDVDGWPQLPIKHARALIAALEARPLTRERFVRHLLELGRGRYGPMQKFVDDMLRNIDQPPAQTGNYLAPEDVDKLLAATSERREELLALLRKSVERNEPLAVG